MLYLLLDDYVAEDTHSGNSSVGTGAPQGISAQFSLQLMLGIKRPFKWTVKHLKLPDFKFSGSVQTLVDSKNYMADPISRVYMILHAEAFL